MKKLIAVTIIAIVSACALFATEITSRNVLVAQTGDTIVTASCVASEKMVDELVDILEPFDMEVEVYRNLEEEELIDLAIEAGERAYEILGGSVEVYSMSLTDRYCSLAVSSRSISEYVIAMETLMEA